MIQQVEKDDQMSHRVEMKKLKPNVNIVQPQARRERRSTQSVTVEDIKAAEQQIKNQPNISETSSSSSSSLSLVKIPQPATNVVEPTSNVTLANNKIGAPSTPSSMTEHDIETERLQRVIEEKKEKARRASGGNEVSSNYSFNVDYSFFFSFFVFFSQHALFFSSLHCLFIQLTKITNRHALSIINRQR